MTSYLVTGGAGFIGSHIVERLVNQRLAQMTAGLEPDTIRVLDDFSTGFEKNIAPYLATFNIELFDGSLTDAETVARAVDGVEIIFHEAALASVPLSIEQPMRVHNACVTGTVQLLDCARRAGVRRVVYAASSSAYGDTEVCPTPESVLPAPISPYGAAKLAAELYLEAFAASYGLETVRLRYFNVFGPRQDPKSPYSAVIPLFISAMLKGQAPTIFGDGRQSRDFTFVSNIVDANLLAAQAPAEDVSGKVFNIANGKSVDLLTLVSTLNEILRTQIEPKHLPPRVGDILESRADISAARRFLKYEPQTGLLEGLRQTVEWYKNS
ncbi:MAG: SDR family oxidoreductase [Thermoguttaceae bacterium]|nr:SDR family oxidoreductase [Thermoguttaceae bacterium]MBR0193021.1 SDR family oxidoreductase [Thermoguttaceae bacterium]